MATDTIDEAMLEASRAIEKVSRQVSGFETQNRTVVEALKDLSNRMGALEQATKANPGPKASKPKIMPSYPLRVRQ